MDTHVVCEATAKHPEARVLAWIENHSHECFLSSVSLGEIWKGLHRLPEGKRKRGLVRWADGLEIDFAEQILGLDTLTLKSWGKLYAKHEARGFNMDVIDSLIAATALVHQLTMVTRNTADFPPDVKTFNPWRE
ncbi:MAG: type II toxin-antitoxin system VapC family toxin [Akkermansiaceae bacterium]|nr:type II toxin-antitoxin system VapC family toxin [Akkermansiaceae bacterium]MCF7733357.1 type II toxin-antitoxin system VapC family toxin [Akkermansiaceae bacterium]